MNSGVGQVEICPECTIELWGFAFFNSCKHTSGGFGRCKHCGESTLNNAWVDTEDYEVQKKKQLKKETSCDECTCKEEKELVLCRPCGDKISPGSNHSFVIVGKKYCYQCNQCLPPGSIYIAAEGPAEEPKKEAPPLLDALSKFIELSDFEQRIIVEQIHRLHEGREIYGEWTPGKKNTEQEALEEIMDGMNYVAARLVELKKSK